MFCEACYMRNHGGVSASKARYVKAEVKAFRIGDRSAVHEKNDDKNTVDKEENKFRNIKQTKKTTTTIRNGNHYCWGMSVGNKNYNT